MKIEATEFIDEPYNNRLGFVKINVKENPNLYYLYVAARDKETGDVKCFPPAQKTKNGFIPYFRVPEDARKEMERVAKTFVENAIERLEI